MRQKLHEYYSKSSVSLNYLFRTLKILASGGKLYLLIIMLFTVAFGAMPSISILVMQEIVNTLQESDRNFEYIFMLISIYIGIDIFKGIAGMLSGYIENVLQMKAAITLKMSVLEKVEELSLQDFENSETYNLIQRAAGIGIGTLYSFFKSFLLVFQLLINLVMFSMILITWHWWLLPIIFVIPIINALVAAYFGKKQFLILRERAEDGRKQWYFQHLLTTDIAFNEIKTFNIGDYFRNKYKQLSLKFLKQDRKLLNQRSIVASVLLVIDQFVVATLFVFIVLQAFLGHILLGDLITYTRSISNVKASSQSFLGQINAIYQNILQISQYFEFIDMKSKTNEHCNAQSLQNISFIEIKNLSYQYKNKEDYALRNVNINIENGSLVAFIGENGSGKSTLVKILSTLYTDYHGDIFFGKQNLRDLNKDEVQKKIGILFQNFVKYELSARENVALGQLEKINDDAMVVQALLKTGMNEKISDLESQLGFWFENGMQLSGGEWLRIALSRAFIRDADLFLLDEPNSALDAKSERQVLNSFKKLCEGKIGIIISHRITSIKNIVDKIVVFENGSIQACGTHDELLETSEVYRKLYDQENGVNVDDYQS